VAVCAEAASRPVFGWDARKFKPEWRCLMYTEHSTRHSARPCRWLSARVCVVLVNLVAVVAVIQRSAFAHFYSQTILIRGSFGSSGLADLTVDQPTNMGH
jgi:hypothetical protein